jgi:hypothetical protein
MMETKYHELVSANQRRSELYENYETECRAFIGQLRNSLVDFLGCSEEQVRWLTFAEEESEEFRSKDIVELTRDRSMALQTDAFYQFAFRIMFRSKWLDLQLRVKKMDDHFAVQLGKGRRNLQLGRQEDLDELVSHLFEVMKEYLETDFARFVQGEPSTLGFRTP